MNKITKKLMLSFLTVILAIGALGTTTFAWFTLSNVATIDLFEADIMGEYGIEISVDQVDYLNKTWYNNINENLIKTAYGLDNFKFNHITTTDGLIYSSINSLHEVEADTNGSLKNKSYLEFEIFFRSPDLTQIKLTGITMEGEEHVWKADVGFADFVEGEQIFVNSINALRISFASQSVVGVNENIVAYERAAFSGANLAANTYMDTTVEYASNTALIYYNEKNGTYPGAGLNEEEESNMPSLITTRGIVLTNNKADLVAQEKDMIFELTTSYTDSNQIEYNTGSVIVRVWIEGFDAEAYNAILKLPINFGFIFEGVKPSSPEPDPEP